MITSHEMNVKNGFGPTKYMREEKGRNSQQSLKAFHIMYGIGIRNILTPSCTALTGIGKDGSRGKVFQRMELVS